MNCLVRRVLILTALLLAACDPPARSASYFQSHATERQQVLAACKGGQQRGHECETASTAEAEASSADAEAKFRARLGGK